VASPFRAVLARELSRNLQMPEFDVLGISSAVQTDAVNLALDPTGDTVQDHPMRLIQTSR
jgi:hypothetical protein